MTPTPRSSDAAHAAHDRLAVAALATRTPDLDATASAAAEAQVRDCADCRALHDDLVAIATALPTTTTPARPREYVLTEADAKRLKPSGPRAWLRAIGTARDTITRPLAIGLTTMGIAGLLVATAPTVALFGAAGAAPASASEAPAAAAASQAPSEAPATESLSIAAPSPVDDGGVFQGSDNGDGAARSANPEIAGEAAGPAAIDVRDDATGLSTLAVVAGTLTILGLGLFLLRWSARRFS